MGLRSVEKSDEEVLLETVAKIVFSVFWKENLQLEEEKKRTGLTNFLKYWTEMVTNFVKYWKTEIWCLIFLKTEMFWNLLKNWNLLKIETFEKFIERLKISWKTRKSNWIGYGDNCYSWSFLKKWNFIFNFWQTLFFLRNDMKMKLQNIGALFYACLFC